MLASCKSKGNYLLSVIWFDVLCVFALSSTPHPLLLLLCECDEHTFSVVKLSFSPLPFPVLFNWQSSACRSAVKCLSIEDAKWPYRERCNSSSSSSDGVYLSGWLAPTLHRSRRPTIVSFSFSLFLSVCVNWTDDRSIRSRALKLGRMSAKLIFIYKLARTHRHSLDTFCLEYLNSTL